MRILVAMPVEERHKALLKEAAQKAEFIFCPSAQVTEELAQSVDIIIGNVKPQKIAGTDRLRWMQLNSAGTDGYLEPGVLPEGTLLTNATGAYGLAISEHMLGMVLELKKKLYLYHQNQLAECWKDEGKVTSIFGSVTLVIGLGDIGSEFASRMKALGSYVIGIRRTKAEKPDYVDQLRQMDGLEDCLKRAAVVELSLPGTKETYRLMDTNRLACMKKSAVLINVGRGTAVDTEALCDALEQGRIAGAGLDVTDPEPLPPGHRLWKAPNVVITPHISGLYHLQETHERIVGIAAENLAAFLEGRPMRSLVDRSTGYRAVKQ